MSNWLCPWAHERPALFQAQVSDVFQDTLSRFVFICLDDIPIFSKSVQEHVHHVQAILKTLLENALFVKTEKYHHHH